MVNFNYLRLIQDKFKCKNSSYGAAVLTRRLERFPIQVVSLATVKPISKMWKFVLFLTFTISIELEASDVRIVNGVDASDGEFPFAVSLRRNGRHSCGATILNENYILTAAHCVCKDNTPLNPKNFSIQYGLTKITPDDLNTVQVEKIVCNDFKSKSLIYDSAVLKLISPIPDDDSWESVKVSKEFDAKEARNGTIIGWGRLSHNGPLSTNLKKLDVTVYDGNLCKFKYDPIHHICLGADNAGACNGDSGTALLVDGIQIGIASFITANCGIADKNTPNVYSKVATYYDWIVSIAGQVKSSSLA